MGHSTLNFRLFPLPQTSNRVFNTITTERAMRLLVVLLDKLETVSRTVSLASLLTVSALLTSQDMNKDKDRRSDRFAQLGQETGREGEIRARLTHQRA